ncbi:Imm51 family immunity protein [Saccharibacillus deserti]|uniref:Imm51 family immunity protein n=1 Tax=Saccharibacillus deserti TaxID=1634444 RepID=UPI0015519021|nr:Imm51 family immunity protein [Saccharibacillus deserti]
MTENQRNTEPFTRVTHGEIQASVILEAGSYKNEWFERRAEEGVTGSGSDWASLADVFLQEKMPHLDGIVKFDPESSMFAAYSGDPESLRLFIYGFKDACEDDVLIRSLFSRAILD